MERLFQIGNSFYVDIFSIIIVVVLIAAMIIGCIKGFVKELIGLISIFVIIGACVFLSKPLANLLASTSVGNSLYGGILQKVNSIDETLMTTVISEESKDQILAQAIAKLNIPSVLSDLLNQLISPLVEKNMGVTIGEVVAKGFTNILLETISSILIIIVVGIVLLILRKLCKFIDKTKVISGFNRLFGLIFAFAIAYIVMDALLFATSYIIVHDEWAASSWLMNTMYLNETDEGIITISKFMYEHSIVKFIVEQIH